MNAAIKILCTACTVLAVWATVAPNGYAASASAVYIVDTRGNATSEAFVEGLRAKCIPCETAKYYDAKGDPKKLNAIISDIDDGTFPVVVAIGGPAVLAVSNQLPRARVIPALTNKTPANQGNILSSKLTGEWSQSNTLYLAESVFGAETVIGFVGGPQTIGALKRELSVNTSSVKRNFYAVEEPGALPDIVMRAYAEADLVVFLKDASVLNRRSAEYIVKASITQPALTMVFSSALVDMGIPLGIAPDARILGENGASVVVAALDNQNDNEAYGARNFVLHVNCAAAKRFNRDSVEHTGATLCGKPELSLRVAGPLRISTR